MGRFLMQKKGCVSLYRKIYSSREFKKLLKDNGWESTGRWNGDHEIFSNGTDTIPIDNREVNRMIQFRLIKEYNLVDKKDKKKVAIM